MAKSPRNAHIQQKRQADITVRCGYCGAAVNWRRAAPIRIGHMGWVYDKYDDTPKAYVPMIRTVTGCVDCQYLLLKEDAKAIGRGYKRGFLNDRLR